MYAGCLDYILLRNPPAAAVRRGGGGGPPRARLALRGVGALPSRESLEGAPEGAAPSSAHASDHFPLTAVYEAVVEESQEG